MRLFSRCPEYDLAGKYAAIDVACYIVNKCVHDGKKITDLQLQKIMYYIQRYFLRQERRSLFMDDIEAWMYGPVIPAVYRRYCGFGSSDLYDIDDPTIDFANGEKKAIDDIVEEKRALWPRDMVNDTHRKGGAWERIYQDGLGDHRVIPKEMIAIYG